MKTGIVFAALAILAAILIIASPVFAADSFGSGSGITSQSYSAFDDPSDAVLDPTSIEPAAGDATTDTGDEDTGSATDEQASTEPASTEPEQTPPPAE